MSSISVSTTGDHHYHPLVASARCAAGKQICGHHNLRVTRAPPGLGSLLSITCVWPSGRLHFFFAAALAPIARNQFAAMHRKGVIFDRAPLVMAIAAECLCRLFRVVKGEDLSQGSVSQRLWRG